MSYENPKFSQAADQLIALIIKYEEQINGKTPDPKKVRQIANEIIKRQAV